DQGVRGNPQQFGGPLQQQVTRGVGDALPVAEDPDALRRDLDGELTPRLPAWFRKAEGVLRIAHERGKSFEPLRRLGLLAKPQDHRVAGEAQNLPVHVVVEGDRGVAVRPAADGGLLAVGEVKPRLLLYGGSLLVTYLSAEAVALHPGVR